MGDGSRVLGNEKRLGKGTQCERAGPLKGTINSPARLELCVSRRVRRQLAVEKWVETSTEGLLGQAKSQAGPRQGPLIWIIPTVGSC